MQPWHVNGSSLAVVPPFLFLLCFGLLSCGEQPRFSTFEDVANEEWNATDTLQITVKSTELTGKEPVLMIRHSDDYSFQNIWLKIAIDSNKFERKELMLANGQGAWLGKKGGGLYTLETPLKEMTLPSDSTTISIVQTMRANPLKGVQAVGVKVE